MSLDPAYGRSTSDPQEAQGCRGCSADSARDEESEVEYHRGSGNLCKDHEAMADELHAQGMAEDAAWEAAQEDPHNGKSTPPNRAHESSRRPNIDPRTK